MELNNTFKRELTVALRERFPKLEVRHEDRYISFKWKEIEVDKKEPIQMHWVGLENGGRNQSTVLHTFGFVEAAKSDFHKKVEKEILDFSQKFLDKWIREKKEIF
jgi:hypothetical protein